jgi:hypothetical protein
MQRSAFLCSLPRRARTENIGLKLFGFDQPPWMSQIVQDGCCYDKVIARESASKQKQKMQAFVIIA